MTPTTPEILATLIFTVAVFHSFGSSRFQSLAHKFPEGSIKENFFHLMGEVEVVFGLWAGVLIACMAALVGSTKAIEYAEGLNFTEPLFVFAVMTMAATRPVIGLAGKCIQKFSLLIPVNRKLALYLSCLLVGPLLGSLITEPAAMTVTAILLKRYYFDQESSSRFKYVTLAVLFVNVSIGGVLTPYAAPPVLMVATKWNWTLGFMLKTFGWKASLAVFLNACLAAVLNAKEVNKMPFVKSNESEGQTPLLLLIIHILFLCVVVMTSHHAVIFMGAFLFFLGLTTITKEYQDEIKLRESLLVAFFLGGLVILGGLQRWWLQPLIQKFDALPLYLGATILTAFTDNAALTYLGSQVENVSPSYQYALVGGAIAGGGLTVIANAPNPAGFSILQSSFGEEGISPIRLFVTALTPTIIAMSLLWFLP